MFVIIIIKDHCTYKELKICMKRRGNLNFSDIKFALLKVKGKCSHTTGVGTCICYI